jgi:polyadenylate-binding protein
MIPGPKWAQQGMPGVMQAFPAPMTGAPPAARPAGQMPAGARRGPIPPQRGGVAATAMGRGVGIPPVQPQPRGPPKQAAPQLQNQYAFSKQARNKEVGPVAGVPQTVPAAAAPVMAETTALAAGPLSANELARMSPDQQKNALGERLFARISETPAGPYAAKITGMLLEMDVTETLNLLETPDLLDSKIDEALTVLKQHEQQTGLNAQ